MLKTGSEDDIAVAAAEALAYRIRQAVTNRGCCTLVLAGGNSPRKLYQRLAGTSPPGNTATVSLPWASTMLFWGDERCVANNDTASNYRMAVESLISQTDIPENNIYPMPQVTSGHDDAAWSYEKKLRSFFETQEHGIRNSFPVFDIVILGMGSDGHTASLFPGHRQVLQEPVRWVLPVFAEEGSPPGWRLSLTLQVINNARSVLFYVVGKSKEQTVLDIDSCRRPDLPAAMVKPEHGELLWFYGK